MKQPTFCGRELLSLSVIEAARAGDPLAVERVLRYYEGYINKLCRRKSNAHNNTRQVEKSSNFISCQPVDYAVRFYTGSDGDCLVCHAEYIFWRMGSRI